MRIFTLSALLLIYSFSLFAQTIPTKGVPFLKNYTPADFQDSGKAWDIDSAPNGIMYFATDTGLLEFDGINWKKYESNESIIRSLLVINDSLIYSGSDLDFGVWKRNDLNQFEYTSLYQFKEDLNQLNEQFWEIHRIENDILFVSKQNAYLYKEESLTKIAFNTPIDKSFSLGSEIYFADKDAKIYRLNNLSLESYSSLSSARKINFVGLFNDDGTKILVSQSNGLYKLEAENIEPINSDLSGLLREQTVFSFQETPENLVFGTILKGILIYGKDGSSIQHIDKKKGLLNNTVLSLHVGKNQKLWTGLDYGISFVQLSGNTSYIYDYDGNFGSGYSAVLKNDRFYLGTNQGLYTINWGNLNSSIDENGYGFRIVNGSAGQVWSVQEFDNQLWINHDRGMFLYQNGDLKNISDTQGFYTIEPYKSYVLAGGYNGVAIFRKQANQWNQWKMLDQISGSCNQVLVDSDDKVWINIPNYGIIKASLDENLEVDNRDIFLKNEFNGEVQYIEIANVEIYVVTDQSRYVFNSAENNFSVVDGSVVEFGTESSKRFISRPGFQSLNDRYDFIPLYNGFGLRDQDLNKNQREPEYQLIIRTVKAYNNEDSKVITRTREAPFHLNSIRINYVVPNTEGVKYFYKLPDEIDWKQTEKAGEIELVGLSRGDMDVDLMAKVNNEIELTETIQFQIASPWYLSGYAYAVYIILGFSFAFGFYYIQANSIKRYKRGFLRDQRIKLIENRENYEKMIQSFKEKNLREKYDQVKADLKAKTVELASKAKENEEKNAILQSLKDKLEKIEKNPDSFKHRYSELSNIIDSHLDQEDDTFAIQIDELHQDFFDKLREKYPELTTYDLRLCAYVKRGFNSKEIAELLNIKPSSVYISRSRLRKKLGIETDDDLSSFLNSV